MARPQRLDGISYCGPARYFLTFCTRERRPVFLDPQVAVTTTAAFQHSARLDRFALLAYCLMPDHAHLLVEGLAVQSDLRRFAKMAKQRSGAAHALARGKTLWQEGYYERVLRGDEDAFAMARYIVANPLRAGLVASARDYPYLGSDRWPLDELW